VSNVPCMLLLAATVGVAIIAPTAADRSVSPVSSGGQRFRMSEFAKPNRVTYGPVWMWTWNDALTEPILREQVEDITSHGAGTLMPIAEPKEFRPNTMVTYLSPDYLSDAFFSRYRYMVEQSARVGSQVWIYDEGGWPSGMVCWSLPTKYPQFRSQVIERQEISPKPGETVDIPGDCVSAFLYQGPTRLRRLTPGTKHTADREGDTVIVFRVNPRHYTDLLNPKATRQFMDMVHEKYKNALGGHLGSTVTGIVTDEANIGYAGRAWTDDLVEQFQKDKGYDIRDRLPSLFGGDSREDMQTRVDYIDWVSSRWARAYFKQIQNWCHRNNISLVGELDADHDTAVSAARNGNPLRMYRNMDIPAMDAIWRQIFPGKETHHFPKMPSSAAHQERKPRVMSESFCVYGSGLTPEQMKWILDYQYVRGVNLFQPCLYQLSTKDFFQAGERPVFGPGNPLWKYMDAYGDYIARLSYVMTLGTPDIRTAVYCPFRDLWAGLSEAGVSMDKAAITLLQSQCDYDFIDDDVLERDSSRIAGGELRVGPMSYNTICVPACQWMSEKSRRKLESFSLSGGKVLWIDGRPDSPGPNGSVAATVAELAGHVQPLVRVRPANDKVRVSRRSLANGSLYLITNEDTKGISCTLEFDEQLPLTRLDPETGSCFRPADATRSGDRWTLPLNLSYAGSCVLLFSAERLPLLPERADAGAVLLTLDSGWLCGKTRSYALGRHDIEVTELRDEALLPASLGDWRAQVGDGFSGDVEYTVEFQCSGDVAKRAHVLDLGEVRYACSVTLNGHDLGRRLWQPWSFAIDGKLKEGANKLSIIVTNTLANRYLTSRALDRFADKYLGSYHKQAFTFERDSLSSGLFGPVVVR